jgi:hypothetical protein
MSRKLIRSVCERSGYAPLARPFCRPLTRATFPATGGNLNDPTDAELERARNNIVKQFSGIEKMSQGAMDAAFERVVAQNLRWSLADAFNRRSREALAWA